MLLLQENIPSAVFFIIINGVGFHVGQETNAGGRRNTFKLEIEPTTNDKGITERLLLNCSMASNKLAGLSAIKSLTLLKSQESEHTEISSISSVNGYEESNTGDGTGDGMINNTGASYLSLQWQYPNQRMFGDYICRADGISLTGKQVTLQSSASISASELSLLTLSDQMRFIQMENDHILKLNQKMVDRLEDKDAKIARMESEIFDLAFLIENIDVMIKAVLTNFSIQAQQMSHFNDTLTELLMSYSTPGKQLSLPFDNRLRSMRTLFIESNIFQGHRYYLSKQLVLFTPTSAQATCQMFGGYLLEIDNEDEYNFVKGFIMRNDLFLAVYISGNDEATEGSWVNSRTNADLQYVNWYPSEPDNGRTQNCLCLWKQYKWYMASIECVTFELRSLFSYICEIPETVPR